MHLFANLVWRLFISPHDRTLEENMHLIANDNQQIDVKLYDVNDARMKSKYMTKYYIARNNSQKQPQQQQEQQTEKVSRKLLIIFPGRNSNFAQKNNSLYAQRFYKTQKMDDYDIAIVIYPKKAKNLTQLAYACEQAIKQIVTNHDYEMSNSSVMGWCIGAYFATAALMRFAQSMGKDAAKNGNLMFKNFINYKSFASLNEFLYCIMPRFARAVLRLHPVKDYVKMWNINSAWSLKTFEQYFENMLIVYSDRDNIVRQFSHLYKQVNERSFDNMLVLEDNGNTSHRINWNFVADLISKTTFWLNRPTHVQMSFFVSVYSFYYINTPIYIYYVFSSAFSIPNIG